ncbi:hypothetical protein DPEC_G00358760 [Dallia pectoralis]|uniref:Uncharacterized protein n=1 Tax=Dallia pectoralis TaxID=75939 RepID=A0ACC2F0F1_DALPE|nr:hypothetical protein DPEC_G00358760 [Dallia pectoralis]
MKDWGGGTVRKWQSYARVLRVIGRLAAPPRAPASRTACRSGGLLPGREKCAAAGVMAAFESRSANVSTRQRRLKKHTQLDRQPARLSARFFFCFLPPPARFLIVLFTSPSLASSAPRTDGDGRKESRPD